QALALLDLGHHLALGFDRLGEDRLELLGWHADPIPAVEQLLAEGGLVEGGLLVDRVVAEDERHPDEQRNGEHDRLERSALAEAQKLRPHDPEHGETPAAGRRSGWGPDPGTTG